MWGPVYRMVADLGDPASRWQLTTGQSGHPGSPHYDDMIEGWRTGAPIRHTWRSTRSGPPAARETCGSTPTEAREGAEPRDQIKLTPEEVGRFLARERVMNVASNGQRRLAARDRALVRDAGYRPWVWTYRKSQKVKNLERDDRATMLVESGDRVLRS